ncbi:MAG: ATP-dependent zinc metalloprotease FtsH [Symbiobacterium sp.]|uniref:ATP-dependent zinc metalloprotease FtsH n=1 Tax=Symbiobacterium sp. TaxID=1971213 RepID=UPI003464A59D
MGSDSRSRDTTKRILLALFVVWLLQFLFMPPLNNRQNEISYSAFLDALEQGQVAEVLVVDRTVTGKLHSGETFKTILPPETPDLADRLAAAGVEQRYKEATQPWWLALLPTVIWLAAMIGLVVWMQKRQAGAVGLARGTVKPIAPGEATVTFADVAGVDEVKGDLEEVVDYLKNPEKYKAIGARIPKGVLLYGPPGTGKTLLARAVAGEAGVPFFALSGSSFVELFVGMGASRVRELFAQARKNAPCIVFIDEIDAVGRHRGSSAIVGGHDEREQTLNQLLTEMDGFGAYEGVIVMAATNRPDVLDKALLRPGRFDRQVPVGLPDAAGREAILKVHARGKRLAPSVDLAAIAKRTPGFTGADLANLLNEAAILAVRRGREEITMSEIDEAIDRVVAGGPARKGRVMRPEEKRRVAVHEAGHALVATLTPGADPVQKVTIIPRGRAGGFTLTAPEEEQMLYTRSELEARLKMLLGGLCAEEVLMGERSTGAQDDLKRATQLAREMISRYGMGESVGLMTVPDTDWPEVQSVSQESAAAIEREVRSLLSQMYQETRQLLEENRDKLMALAGTLADRETIDGEEVRRILCA